MIIQPPSNPSLKEILPTEPILLMGAGPVPIPPSVSAANGVIINHLGPNMNNVVDGIKKMAAYAFQTKSERVLGVGGPSSAAMEMAVSNLLWPGRSVLVLVNGTFSNRFAEMACGVGADVTIIEADGVSPIDPEMVKKAMLKTSFDVVTMVQGETSCCIKNIHLPEIGKLVSKHDALFIVDAVCTLTTTELLMDEWSIDVCLTGGQKGLSSIPGVSLIAFSDKAWDVIENRKALIPHWVLDAKRAWKFWGEHTYHYTAPVPGLLAIHEALDLIKTETLENRIARHEKASKALQAGIKAIGFDLYVPEEYRLQSVVAISMPDGFNSREMRKIMLHKYGVEIGSAFGHQIVRIGQMGEQCRDENVLKTLDALGRAASEVGFSASIAEGIEVAEKIFKK